MATDDLHHVVFATSRDTHKYGNIQMNPCISMLIDNRANRVEDFNDAKALTILGTAEELCEGEKHEFTSLYLQRYPHLREFISDPNCALMKIEVHRYILVSRFQEVVELDMS